MLDMQLSTLAHQNVCKSTITAQDDLARAFLTDLVVELQQYLMDKLTGASNESMHISNELDQIMESIPSRPLNEIIVNIVQIAPSLGLIITK